MPKDDIFEKLVQQSPNRRSLMRNLGIAAAAAGAAAGTNLFAQSPGGGPSDADIVNFALNLEYLEAEFYTAATTGQTLSQGGVDLTGAGASGPTTGGAKVNFTDPVVQAVAMELAANERAHVILLRTALMSLGITPVAKPAIKLDALGIGFGNQTDFLNLARSFEDVGVTAYGGAAPLIQNKVVLGYAARILAVEALHAGNIRLLIAQNKIATKALDGADHLPPPSGTQYFSTDSNALSEIRTPGQVLYIVYGNSSNAASGGFFPNGVNGALNLSSGGPAITSGASLTIAPNPIPVGSQATTGVATISWNAPSATFIEVHVGSPTGPTLTYNINNGSMVTGNWVTEGQVFYLVDATTTRNPGANGVLATAVAHLQRGSTTGTTM